MEYSTHTIVSMIRKEESALPSKGSIQTERELEFVIFVIESVAMERNVLPVSVLDAFTKQSSLLQDYILPGYEALHTQGKDYIVADVLREAARVGVEV